METVLVDRNAVINSRRLLGISSDGLIAGNPMMQRSQPYLFGFLGAPAHFVYTEPAAFSDSPGVRLDHRTQDIAAADKMPLIGFSGFLSA